MSTEQLLTKLHKGTKQEQHLLSAKCFVFGFFGAAFVSLVELAARHWLFSLAFASLAVVNGLMAFAQYTLSRKTGGE